VYRQAIDIVSEVPLQESAVHRTAPEPASGSAPNGSAAPRSRQSYVSHATAPKPLGCGTRTSADTVIRRPSAALTLTLTLSWFIGIEHTNCDTDAIKIGGNTSIVNPATARSHRALSSSTCSTTALSTA
jgi:hypothetical protein